MALPGPLLGKGQLCLYSVCLLLWEFFILILPQVLLSDPCFLLGFRNVPLSIPSSSILLFQATLLVKVLVTGIVQLLTIVMQNLTLLCIFILAINYSHFQTDRWTIKKKKPPKNHFQKYMAWNRFLNYYFLLSLTSLFTECLKVIPT